MCSSTTPHVQKFFEKNMKELKEFLQEKRETKGKLIVFVSAETEGSFACVNAFSRLYRCFLINGGLFFGLLGMFLSRNHVFLEGLDEVFLTRRGIPLCRQVEHSRQEYFRGGEFRGLRIMRMRK